MLRFADSSSSQDIIFGAGEIDRIGEHLSRLGVERVFLCTSATYHRNGVVERVSGAFGGLLLAVFDGVQPHVPRETVTAAREAVDGMKADAIVALGGGSAIGTAKAVVARCRASGRNPPPRVVAVPTTYAGSEMTAVFGVSSGGRKETATDERVLPRLVIYDPDLTLDLPAVLTAGTGVNALAHCVEGLYTLERTPLGTAAAMGGAGRLYHSLPLLLADGRDHAARETMLVGAHLGGVTMAHAGMALHHAICHALGGIGVAHGVANAIMLPHVMRFNAQVSVGELATLGSAFGVETAQAAIAGVEELLSTLPLPHRLRDAEVSVEQLPEIAAATLASSATRANPRPIGDTEEIEGILRAAW